jgi:hypothetical protein
VVSDVRLAVRVRVTAQVSVPVTQKRLKLTVSQQEANPGMAMTKATGAARKTCFVVMPITTPDSYATDLRDPDHFTHVLELLFTPALEQAGYEVIPPKMLGAAFIHAEIIRNLERADLVLADLSSHNANVFFELGVRTSLDRPVVLVKDKQTVIPFDLGPINVLDYDESIAAWILGEEINRLAEHVKNVPADGDSGNAMWKYFGLTKRGGPAQEGSLDAKVDLLLEEVARLRLSPAVRDEPFESRRIDYDLRPDPLTAKTPAEFMVSLRQFRAWAGNPSLRAMSDQSNPHVSAATLATALSREVLPKLAVVEAVITACGGSEDDQRRFAAGWRRLGVTQDGDDPHEPQQPGDDAT